MNVLPSMDLYSHKITRLKQGNFDHVTTYMMDPAKTLKSFETAGASLVHIVDLEATHTGNNVHFDFIQTMAQTLTLPIQVGGGIRSLAMAEKYLAAGVKRIVLGSLAMSDETALDMLVKKYPGQIVVALDVKDQMVMSHGWLSASGHTLEAVIQRLNSLKSLRYLITDIATDGMLKGPNLDLYRRVKNLTNVPIIASGGITTCEDIQALTDLGVEEAVIGKAMYEDKLPLKEAFKCSQDASSRV